MIQIELKQDFEIKLIEFSKDILGILGNNIIFDEDLPFVFDIDGSVLNSSKNYDSFIKYSAYISETDLKIKEILQIYNLKYRGRVSFFFFHEIEEVDKRIQKQVDFCNKLKSILAHKEKYVKYLQRDELIRQLTEFYNEFVRLIAKLLSDNNMLLFYQFIGNGKEYDFIKSHINLKEIEKTKNNPGKPVQLTSQADVQYSDFTKVYTDYPVKIRNPRFKVLFIAPGYDNLLLLSGVSKVVRDLVLSLAKFERVEVHTILCWFNPTKYFLLKNGKMYNFSSLQELLNFTSELEYDLIHLHTFTINDFNGTPELYEIIDYYSNEEFRIPTIYTVHSDEINEKLTYISQGANKAVVDFKNFTIAAQKGLLKAADKVIHLTNYNLAALVNNFGDIGNLKNKSVVIHNMVEDLEIESFKRLKGDNEGVLNLTYLGRISSEKGIFEFAQIFRNAISGFNRKVVLNIIGGGVKEDTEPLKKIIFGLDNVILHGVKNGDEKDSILAKTDLMIIPSRIETFGLVVAEAMLREITVLANKLPVFEELFGNNIYYFKNNIRDDINGSSAFLIDFVNNFERRVDVSKLKSGRHFIMDNYSSKIVAKKHSELYESLYNQSARRGLIETFKKKKEKYGIDKLEKHIGPVISNMTSGQAKIKKIRRLAGGLSNGAFAIYLDSGQKIALKIYKEKSVQNSIYAIEDSKEYNVYKFINSVNQNIKVPKAYYFGFNENLKRNIILFEMLEGNSLNKIGHLMNIQNYYDVYNMTGKQIALIHNGTFASYCGWIRDSPQKLEMKFSSWYEFYWYLVDEKLKLLRAKNILDDTNCRIIRVFVEMNKNLLENRRMALLHNDLWYENLMISMHGLLIGRYELSGIIDVERAMIGDPVYDIIKMKEWMEDIYSNNPNIFLSLLAGYGISLDSLKPFEDLYKINIYLDSYYVRALNNFRLNDTAKEKFEKLIAKLFEKNNASR